MAKTLTDIIDDIPHKYIRLMAGESRHCAPHRPDIGVWASKDDGCQAMVTVSVGALWGQPLRFLELSPDEARKLARLLATMADTVEAASLAEASP